MNSLYCLAHPQPFPKGMKAHPQPFPKGREILMEG